MPALSNQRFGANQGGRVAVDRDGNLFLIIGDRAPTPPTDYGQQSDSTIGKVLHRSRGQGGCRESFMGKAGYARGLFDGSSQPQGLAINPANGSWRPSMVWGGDG
jgi:glucose/arabinose dehydrogenase